MDEPISKTAEGCSYDRLQQIMGDAAYHPFIRQGVAMAIPELDRLSDLIREALATRAPDYVPGDWHVRAMEAVNYDPAV